MKWGVIALVAIPISIAWIFWKRRWIMANVTGSITESPEELAADAGIDVDAYSLSRVGESEETGEGSIACMWATKNEANRNNVSITRLVTRARMKDDSGQYVVANGDGHYGTQKHRYCSTDHDPSQSMMDNAVAIMEGRIPDPTNGAHHWDAPALQDLEHERDPDNHPSSEEIARRREASGWHMVLVDGVTKTRYWR